MEFKGSSAYEETDFLSNYLQRRNRVDSPNNSIEKPVMYDLLGNIQGQRILDLGCGDAQFGKELLQLGALYYHGVEGAEQMSKLASQNLHGFQGKITKSTMEAYDFPQEDIDIVTSRLAIHYLTDVEELFRKIHDNLKGDGKFVFSVQHPLTTSSFESKKTGERRGNWIVDDYFEEGERHEPWIDKIVVKHHRTIESYFASLTKVGFTITGLREGMPRRQDFQDIEEYERRKRIPVILAFSCSKQ
ncbi:Ubiquinone/menaquinone biosynthesis methyltransferase UBIE [Planococcus halocryophilus Or1]|uniref:Methyltransferase n=1 Tax=Planococcus halocryophilus TaxID=1215089 RepID=A0A1C7DVN7_9BACL|nr:class I SAM-dependent methyltransferase [Planococcus halocryophilus]ANU15474.1 methyltransferase [Planococcus halocryophilus]EMF46245.1 Ubiquinone/menaquinone biosynthesis methyltransferase UBIE [Planococcus halocryophilus Or1]